MIFPTTRHKIKVGQKYMSYISYKSTFKKESDVMIVTEVWDDIVKYKNIYGTISIDTIKDFKNRYVLVDDIFEIK